MHYPCITFSRACEPLHNVCLAIHNSLPVCFSFLLCLLVQYEVRGEDAQEDAPVEVVPGAFYGVATGSGRARKWADPARQWLADRLSECVGDGMMITTLNETTPVFFDAKLKGQMDRVRFLAHYLQRALEAGVEGAPSRKVNGQWLVATITKKFNSRRSTRQKSKKSATAAAAAATGMGVGGAILLQPNQLAALISASGLPGDVAAKMMQINAGTASQGSKTIASVAQTAARVWGHVSSDAEGEGEEEEGDAAAEAAARRLAAKKLALTGATAMEEEEEEEEEHADAKIAAKRKQLGRKSTAEQQAVRLTTAHFALLFLNAS